MPAVVLPAAAAVRAVRAARPDGRPGCAPRPDVLPLTYAFDAIDRVTTTARLGTRGAVDVAVVAGCTLLALALGAATLRRRTA